MLTNLTASLSKRKRLVCLSYRNFAQQVFLSWITLRVGAKIKYRGLMRSLTSLQTESSGDPKPDGPKKWSSNVLHFLRGRMTTLWTTTLALMRFRQGGFLSS